MGDKKSLQQEDLIRSLQGMVKSYKEKLKRMNDQAEMHDLPTAVVDSAITDSSMGISKAMLDTSKLLQNSLKKALVKKKQTVDKEFQMGDSLDEFNLKLADETTLKGMCQ